MLAAALLEDHWHYGCVFTRTPSKIHPKGQRWISNAADLHLLEKLNTKAFQGTGDVSNSVDYEEPDDEPSDLWEASSRFQWHSLSAVFDAFDDNKDGEVSVKEMCALLEKLEIEVSIDSLASLVDSVDENHDKSLNFSEFLKLYDSLYNGGVASENDASAVALGGQDTEEVLVDAFQVYDKNKDGFITATELGAVLSNLGFGLEMNLGACELMIKRADTNGDGKVDFREFKEMMSASVQIPDKKFVKDRNGAAIGDVEAQLMS